MMDSDVPGRDINDCCTDRDQINRDLNDNNIVYIIFILKLFTPEVSCKKIRNRIFFIIFILRSIIYTVNNNNQQDKLKFTFILIQNHIAWLDPIVVYFVLIYLTKCKYVSCYLFLSLLCMHLSGIYSVCRVYNRQSFSIWYLSVNVILNNHVKSNNRLLYANYDLHTTMYLSMPSTHRSCIKYDFYPTIIMTFIDYQI